MYNLRVMSTNSNSLINSPINSPISRSLSGSLIKNQYVVTTGKVGTTINKQFVINVDGQVAKLVNCKSDDKFNVQIIQDVLTGKQKEFSIEWVHFDVV